MENELTKKRAFMLWKEGQYYHESGDLVRAIRLYTESIQVYPTAESYTLRGWAYSFLGFTERAISECKRAIETDPTLGNPYNDIGSYLISLEKLEEAEVWLKKAKVAPRYDDRHFPYMNLGRLYMIKGQLTQAVLEYKEALNIFPGEVFCVIALQQLSRMIN